MSHNVDNTAARPIPAPEKSPPRLHSPVFVATFNDGTQIMTIWHDAEHKALNLDRGIRLAQHAYRSRRGQEPLPIVTARFECDRQILASYTASELSDDPAAEPMKGTTPESEELSLFKAK